MEGALVERRTKTRFRTLYHILKSKSDTVKVAAVSLFLILNALKITLFNYDIVQGQSSDIFKYKLLMTFLLVVIIYPVIIRIRSRAVWITAYTLQTIYILVNMAYFFYFHSYLHVLQGISLFTEAFSITKNFAVPVSPRMLIVLIDLPVFIYLMINYSRSIALRASYRIFIRAAVIVSLCAVFFIEVGNHAQDLSLMQLNHNTYSGESPIVERYGTVANNVLSIYSSKSTKELVSQLQYGEEQTSTAQTQEKPNFVILQVESMDASVINQKYNGSYIAPFLHSLSNKSVYYPFTLSYHEGGGTSDSEFSILNSVEPLDSYPALKLTNYDYPNSMVSALDKASYDTLAFHGNAGSFYNRDVAFPKIGFDDFFDMTKMNLHEYGWGVPDGNVFNYATDTLKTVKQPFFSYVITMTSHEPFNSARNYYNNSAYDGIKDTTVKNYFNSISYVDQSIRSFVSNIETNFKNTYIIILGDHTPNIDTGLYKQASFTMDKKYFEFVPMIIVTPDHKVYKEKKQVASFLDIAPTVLKASGIQYDIKSNGLDLINPDGAAGEVPFKGSSYSRALLFDKAGK